MPCCLYNESAGFKNEVFESGYLLSITFLSEVGFQVWVDRSGEEIG